MKQPRFIFSSFFFLLMVVDFVILPINAESKCSESCGLALASYYLWDNSNLTYIATVMKSEYVTRSQGEDIVSYNNGTIKSKDSVTSSTRINVPFPCECINGKGLSGGVIGGISVGIVAALLLLVFCVYVKCYRRKKMWNKKLVAKDSSENFVRQGETSHNAENRTSASDDTSIIGVKVEKSAEFSYEELANATNNFSLAKKIGQGGFGEVYYGELNGERAAIKKMDMKASKEFLAELKVLTRVHHLNLVRLIGYCVEGSLFLVYEYIENGNLSQHLRNSDSEPLPWSTRVQIALDSARGLEYIHEHTMPVYIHRDVKSENILLDRNFRGKVADFGLTKLIDVGNSSAPTANMAGTFGYMPPEYVYGSVSPKIDVYAFGVVLYELISAKEALMRSGGASGAELKGLVALFEEVFNQPDPKEGLKQMVDPRLGDNYSIESVYKMAQLARACTEGDPQRRPKMRSVVVALMTLSSTTENWDIASFYENPALVNLMSGR
ncbi:chitin elicitor receptor kinase 1-like isoform X1 [Arachis stenosperma]|uniref:chitin elicitor receptor kinase 1-like isoform X1 n=1 Tax=Arachis stenosperma TaxID=217475 RepID=UPI0025AC4B73|nr:chitin elicitor receptor kinase 1-like isoform X1 [Arachis stenosperma]